MAEFLDLVVKIVVCIYVTGYIKVVERSSDRGLRRSCRSRCRSSIQVVLLAPVFKVFWSRQALKACKLASRLCAMIFVGNRPKHWRHNQVMCSMISRLSMYL